MKFQPISPFTETDIKHLVSLMKEDPSGTLLLDLFSLDQEFLFKLKQDSLLEPLIEYLFTLSILEYQPKDSFQLDRTSLLKELIARSIESYLEKLGFQMSLNLFSPRTF